MNLLITGEWKYTPSDRAELERMGHTIVDAPDFKISLPVPYDWVEGVVCNSMFLYHPMEKFNNLRYVQLLSAGLDRVPVDYIREHGIEFHTARGVYSIPMAEFAAGSVLQFYKESRYFREKQAEHTWLKHRGLRELFGKTVCIVGCGDIGRECAVRFRTFGCRILGVNRTVRAAGEYDEMLPLSGLQEALSQSDVVVLTIAQTPETRHLLDAAAFAAMKENAVLVNISRGSVVDTEAMIHWLCHHPDSAAALDVFEEEPLPPGSPLWDMDNVLLTPHNSFIGEGNGDRMKETILRGLA